MPAVRMPAVQMPAVRRDGVPADDRLGLGGYLSPQAERLTCLAEVTWSFDVAADRLGELAGIRLDDETIRRHLHRAAARSIRHRDAHPPRVAFEAAQGDIEFFTDGVMAPTRGGWRDWKLARFQIRPRGVAVEVADWT